MKGKKTLTILVAIAMVASTMIVLNKITDFRMIEEACASTPGVDAFGDATDDLVYDTTYAQNVIKINTSSWIVGPERCYLYFPTYTCSGAAGYPADSFSWDGPYKGDDGITQLYVDPTGGSTDNLATGSNGVTFNRSGMYVFANSTQIPLGNDPTSFAGWIWVNTSTVYDITVSGSNTFDYGTTGSKTITVDTGTDTGCMIGLVRPNNTTAYHQYSGTGSVSLGITGNFSMAGNYNVSAYRDLDVFDQIYLYGDENGNVYNTTYGSDYTGQFPSAPSTNPDNYNFTNMGPWDPPEKNATEVMLTVETASPNIVMTNETTIYWGFDLNMEINVTDQQGDGITGGNISLRKSGTSTYLYNTSFGYVWINETGNGNYTLQIPRYKLPGINWTNLINGSYYLVFIKDVNSDGTEEWNSSTSKRFTIKSASPPVRLAVTDDGSGDTDDLKVNVPSTDPTKAGPADVVNISFTVYGRTVSGTRAYYGDDPWEDEYNLTISGDILYPCSIGAGNLIDNNDGSWKAVVIPTKPGGTITLSVDWPGGNNGSDSETINIINGTIVTASIESFTIGDHVNLTVTVRNMGGTLQEYSKVYLFWRGGGAINDTTGNAGAGRGQNGEYTFWIKPSDQGSTAPRNITIAADTPGFPGGSWGYAKVVMEKNHDLHVNCTPTTTYAGNSEFYNIDILVDGTTKPATYSDITVALYTEDGTLATGDDAWSETGKYDINNANIILSGGTFYLHAYNNTHDSEGHNATIIVTPYTVTSSPSVLAWLIDTNINITFQVNSPITNGTLTLENVSSVPNGSFVGQDEVVDIINGVGTLTGFNSTDLGNITFDYMPEDGESREADGLLRVTTATATPNPATIYIAEATTIEITVTHPATGAPLSDVRVDLDYGVNLTDSKLSKIPDYQTTDADGKVQFAVTAEASGNVTIYLKMGSDPDNPMVIKAAARKTMTITTDPSVEEGGTFTVSAKDANQDLITDATVNILFNGVTTSTITGTLELTAPAVPVSLDYRIEATAEGYTSDDAIIKVINKPKLFAKAPSKGTKDESFTVTAGGDDGNSYGITITITDANGNTVKTATTVGPSGVSFTISNTGTYTITATKDNYAPSDAVTIKIEAPTPGFELLTLIIALGVAYILLKRRRR